MTFKILIWNIDFNILKVNMTSRNISSIYSFAKINDRQFDIDTLLLCHTGLYGRRRPSADGPSVHVIGTLFLMWPCGSSVAMRGIYEIWLRINFLSFLTSVPYQKTFVYLHASFQRICTFCNLYILFNILNGTWKIIGH